MNPPHLLPTLVVIVAPLSPKLLSNRLLEVNWLLDSCKYSSLSAILVFHLL